jgi:acetolactate synthase-1/2/3 large subunit
MNTQLAGHLLVECLIEQGVTHAFGVPGESYLAVLGRHHTYPRRAGHRCGMTVVMRR